MRASGSSLNEGLKYCQKPPACQTSGHHAAWKKVKRAALALLESGLCLLASLLPVVDYHTGESAPHTNMTVDICTSWY